MTINESQVTSRWLNLGRGVSLGIAADGFWSLATANGVVPLKSDGDFTRLLIILEQPFEQVLDTIDRYRKQEAPHAPSPVQALSGRKRWCDWLSWKISVFR